MLEIPAGFQFTHGDSIHTSADPRPHLTGTLQGVTVHIPYGGQTTLGMFDTALGGHRVGDVGVLHDRFPGAFRNSGF